MLDAEKDIFELVHASVGKEQSGVIGRDQGGRMHTAVALRLKEAQEHLSYFGAGTGLHVPSLAARGYDAGIHSEGCMARRVLAVFLLLSAFASGCMAQKCKGMEVKYENAIQYPNTARASGLQGDVVLQIHISADGTVAADIVSGPSILAESAKRFVLSWSVVWPSDAPPTACAPVLHVAYKLKKDHFKVKMKLPTHIVVEAPPIEINGTASTLPR